MALGVFFNHEKINWTRKYARGIRYDGLADTIDFTENSLMTLAGVQLKNDVTNGIFDILKEYAKAYATGYGANLFAVGGAALMTAARSAQGRLPWSGKMFIRGGPVASTETEETFACDYCTKKDAMDFAALVEAYLSADESVEYLDGIDHLFDSDDADPLGTRTHNGTTETQGGKTYEFEHVYFSSTGRANAAAEAFLDALNAWNTLSDNNKLSPHECSSGRCSATAPITVKDRKHAVDTPQDLDMVRRMSNVSVAYGEGTHVQHWDPLKPAQFANVVDVDKVANVEEVTDTTATESMKSAAWEKIREGYARLKKSVHNLPGWYYLLTFAELKNQDVLMFYEVRDIEGNVATVPVLRHSPELTVQHTRNGHNYAVKNSNELEDLFDVSSYIQNENGAEFTKIKLLNDSVKYDVQLKK